MLNFGLQENCECSCGSTC